MSKTLRTSLYLCCLATWLLVSCSTPKTTITPSVEPKSTDDSQVAATAIVTSPGPIQHSVTSALNGETIQMRSGEQISLELEAGYNWQVGLSDKSLLLTLSEEVAGKGGSYHGLFEAAKPGLVELRAQGDPLCLTASPPCGLPSILFQLSIQIEN